MLVNRNPHAQCDYSSKSRTRKCRLSHHRSETKCRSASFSRRFAAALLTYRYSILVRGFRSDAALEAIRKASENKTPNLVLYNYPSFSGAYGALFAHLYHCRLNLPCLILPFSAVAPFSVEDLCIEGMKTCYFLDFLGSKGLALELSMRTTSKVIGFDHRKSVLSQISPREGSDMNVSFYVNIEKSSSTAAYEYFSAKLSETGNNLMEICSMDLIMKGSTYLSHRQIDASKLLHKVFRVRLGRGFYGECLGVRADGNSDFSDEMGMELSQRSAAAGLRPIGAVIYMQRNNLKMCLRTVDSSTDTSEVAKVRGFG
ncbi:UNVERIFIED_CONTAM: hypothetical protein Slati_3268400 [Sesamum latifolium]|uniref:Uncharacterized protein n=1 Tax=Sesamum latifolium TaxID=2727402 RepID=A0AAW2UY62_9LAMI